MVTGVVLWVGDGQCGNVVRGKQGTCTGRVAGEGTKFAEQHRLTALTAHSLLTAVCVCADSLTHSLSD